jgi:hypothetical protein
VAHRRLAVWCSLHHPAQRLRALDPLGPVAAAGPTSRARLATACGNEVLPSAVVADSRSLRSAPTAWVRGIDGGKRVKGVKLFAICDKHGSLLDLELRPANTDDRAGVLPMLPRLAALGFEGDLLGDSGFKGAPFAAAALEHDIHISSRLAVRVTGASCRTASGGSSSGYSPGLAATGGSTSSTTAPPTSLPGTSGLR